MAFTRGDASTSCSISYSDLSACTTSTRDAREGVAARRAGGDPDRSNHDAFREHASQDVLRRGPDGQPHAKLACARTHRERQHARHTDDGDPGVMTTALLIATGGRSRRVSIPGGDLEGISQA
ncbi:MAG: hypothetical protein HYS05_13470 [Acidobacteria bacterium]|nr:hypothetical protein [Acidobacteriota bacterium]